MTRLVVLKGFVSQKRKPIDISRALRLCCLRLQKTNGPYYRSVKIDGCVNLQAALQIRYVWKITQYSYSNRHSHSCNIFYQSMCNSTTKWLSLRTDSRKAYNRIPSPLTIFNQLSTSLQCHSVICTCDNYCNPLQPMVTFGTVIFYITKLRVFYECFIHTFRVVPKNISNSFPKKTN